MEVHHHPHVEKKRFKEYFLEFLMIFLAVTLGFFAENLREHFNDNSEIQNDMQSMIADLRTDVAMYNSFSTINQLSDRRIDTLITFLKTGGSNTADIYYLARYITANNNTYTPNTKTFDQMKSSGALKLIQPRKILDSISDYYQSLQYFPGVNNLQNEKLSEIHVANSQLFDGSVFQKMFEVAPSEFAVAGNIKKPGGNPALLSNDFKVINSVITAYHYLYAVTEINDKAAVVRRKNAEKLISLLEKEYKLKQE